MRGIKTFPAILALAAMPLATAAQETPNVSQVVDKIVAQERAEIMAIRRYSPLVETYIQTVRPDKSLGAAPSGDRYFLGRAELAQGVDLEPLINGNGDGKRKFLTAVGNIFSTEFLPGGFLQMIYLDEEGFDRQHYAFSYEGREFLGEVRCLVFDVEPLPKSGKGRFSGRVWVEDLDYSIVRFNGSYSGSGRSSFYFNFDSWRENAGKNEWLPAFIYSEEGNVEYGVSPRSGVRPFKAQTRLWGYNLNRTNEEQTLSTLVVEGPKVKDQADAGDGYSPLQARRAWGRLAEDNVAAKMQRTGLMAPYGEVDKVLETVVNNLEVTNELDIQPEVRCRVLMTSTLESFTMGHTIVLSRGLIDVLPDEASLAAVLSHELAHVVLGHRMDTEYAFFNRVRFDEKETFRHFGFARTEEEEEAASRKGMELLKKSPYKDKTGTARAFFTALQSREKVLPNLISPHLGDRVPSYWTASPASAQEEKGAKHPREAVALPLGGRIKIGPFDDRLVMLKAKPEEAVADFERMPFEVAPFLVYLTRQNGNAQLLNSRVNDEGAVAARSESAAPAPEIKPE